MKNDKVVLITGCSTGIGRELCKVLTDTGYDVIATARNMDAIKDLRVALQLPLDVTKKDSIDPAINKAISRFGRIDILINNAGYAIRGALEEVSEENVKNLFDVNVFGILNMVKAVAPQMRKNHGGKIINIGSIAGLFAAPVNGAYCASKYAVEAITDTLRLELYNQNIQVTVIEPGPVKTQFLETSIANSSSLMDNKDTCYAALYQSFIDFMREQKTVNPDYVAKTITGIIAQKRLKNRYEVGVPYSSSMMARFSDPVREYLLRKGFNIS